MYFVKQVIWKSGENVMYLISIISQNLDFFTRHRCRIGSLTLRVKKVCKLSSNEQIIDIKDKNDL